MKKFLKFDIDLAWDDSEGSGESLETLLESIYAEVSSITIDVIRAQGSGGGWPEVSVLVAEDEVKKFFEIIGFDDVEAAEIAEDAERIEAAI